MNEKKRKVPRIIPYRRGAAYKSVCIRGSDKFILLSHMLVFNEEEYLRIADIVGRKEEAEHLCQQYHTNNAAMLTASAHAWAWAPPPWQQGRGLCGAMELIRAYLYENSISSFGVSTASFMPILAFRDKKDYFKYALKFGDTTRIRLWDSGLKFWVFIDENDPVPFENRSAEDWNQSDPKGGWL
jgi:hypothetical protein